MLACSTWLADDFLLRQGWTITDPGNGAIRTVERDGRTLSLGPACSCCPPRTEPNYRTVLPLPVAA